MTADDIVRIIAAVTLLVVSGGIFSERIVDIIRALQRRDEDE